MSTAKMRKRPLTTVVGERTCKDSLNLRLIDMTSHEIGREGERIACEFLERAGFAIHMRNWHAPHGEVDLVASDNGVVVLVEVKTRRVSPEDDWAAPEIAVDPYKQRRYRWLAQDFLRRHSAPYGMRFDIVSVSFDEHDRPHVRHLKDAFECDV